MANKNRNTASKSKGRGKYRPGGKKDWDAGKDAKMLRDQDNSSKGKNDPSWYASDQSLLRDAASIPFSWSTGRSFSLDIPAFPMKMAIPGIQVEYLYPSMGHSMEPTSPINMAATATYSFVRHANSGHANYDSPDLMMYIMAMSQVYSYINFLMRVYGTMTMYAQKNRYMPKALIESMGVNFESVQSSLADFRYAVNVLINKTASFAVPANMTLFLRQAFLYQYIYIEGSSVKDQMYMYSPAAFYQYTLDEGAGATSLVLLPFYNPGSDNLKTTQQLLDYGFSLINPLVESEDMNIMSGDILKAYGDGGILKLQSLPEDYLVLPVFDIGVLEQMKNATVVSHAKAETFSVVQDPTVGYIISNPQVYSDDPSATIGKELAEGIIHVYDSNRILTTTTADVTPELVIESTRLMVCANNLKELPSPYEGASMDLICGTEVCVACIQYGYIWNNNVMSLGQWAHQFLEYISAIGEVNRLCGAGHFRFVPMSHYFNVTTPTTMNYLNYRFDVDNYAILFPQDLERMHEAAVMNELHVPSIGKLS